jgi:hypothetical protein
MYFVGGNMIRLIIPTLAVLGAVSFLSGCGKKDDSTTSQSDEVIPAVKLNFTADQHDMKQNKFIIAKTKAASIYQDFTFTTSSTSKITKLQSSLSNNVKCDSGKDTTTLKFDVFVDNELQSSPNLIETTSFTLKKGSEAKLRVSVKNPDHCDVDVDFQFALQIEGNAKEEIHPEPTPSPSSSPNPPTPSQPTEEQILKNRVMLNLQGTWDSSLSATPWKITASSLQVELAHCNAIGTITAMTDEAIPSIGKQGKLTVQFSQSSNDWFCPGVGTTTFDYTLFTTNVSRRHMTLMDSQTRYEHRIEISYR